VDSGVLKAFMRVGRGISPTRPKILAVRVTFCVTVARQSHVKALLLSDVRGTAVHKELIAFLFRHRCFSDNIGNRKEE
jgi:hypothetical protein